MAKQAADLEREARGEPARTADAGQRGEPEERSLKGTFASVMLLGAFLIATWVSVFVLFVHRQ